MIYCDTNFLQAAFFDQTERTSLVERFLRRNSQPLLVGELAELEAENVFARMSKQSESLQWVRLQQRLDSGEWRREPANWTAVRTRARELFRRYSHRGTLGTFDIFHLAAAQLAGCRVFASFDTGSSARALAAALRLETFPDLTARDRELLALLRRP